MGLSDAGRRAAQNFTKFVEGFRGRPYKDTQGNETILWGRNLTAKPFTEAEGELSFENDWNYAENFVIKNFPWALNLDDARLGVLINMTYNVGNVGITKFKNFLDLLKENKFEEAANDLSKTEAAKEAKDRYARISEIIKTGDINKGFQ